MTMPKNLTPDELAEYIRKRKEKQKSPEFKAKRNERLRKKYNEDEEHRKKLNEKQKSYMRDVVANDEALASKYRERKVAHARKLFETDVEYRKRRSQYTVARKKNIRTQAEYDAFMAALEKEEGDDSNIS